MRLYIVQHRIESKIISLLFRMVHLFDFGDLQAGRFVEQVLPNGLCHQRIGDDCFDIHRQMLMANEGGP